ncbi:MAG: type I-E CRISPR-associated protein Cas5/CasD [Lachnospiraceae bacterium]|nr:type I-E CRISPR-associated protein Cas5/CasD [Lachnospiraceae bacterium]
MATLLLRLAAPLQSWGSSSKFEIRTTEKMPTKSGVVGMLAAALGLRRDADLARLNALKFGVRADREGEDITDFHMAHSEKSSYVTYRHYLCDAVFLAGLEGEEELLKELEVALHNPQFPLFLGRRSCPPTLPVVMGIRNLPLETALRKEAPLTEKHENLLRIQIETDNSDAGMIQDMPISFNPARRVYGYRRIREDFVEYSQNETEHDAMQELG